MTLLAQTAAPTAAGAGTSPYLWIAIAVIVVIVVALAVSARRRRSDHLRQQFGPEYDRAVARDGSTRRAEADLAARERRHRALDIRALPPGARDRYTEEWRGIQARFVDEPNAAVTEADRLLTNVMRDRGYPLGDIDQRIDDLSVEHGRVIDNYRAAREIAARNDRGQASTVDLRNAMLDYRSLFSDLLGADPVAAARR
jgi:hypothetical protein